ncbi:peptide/nickel transport system ATP-binding protein [Roseateles sp. YR242]|uniref:ABC transporter ATP-binding protein n=1 Tax=Roseateles sp. YR242 TaxID=1855305 RepID=UPI0008ABF066|nr:ABC transporter ATP-binding protein [Roseateles sp. YR242]SEK80669.1 peptide/nickel transport system ATP-binding protein [Roseateles sp. YR242]
MTPDTPANSSVAPHTAAAAVPAIVPVPVLETEHLTQRYEGREVLQDINLRLQPGESLGIIGESGAGKSTLARLVMALERPAAGVVRWSGEDIHRLPEHQRRARRSRVQMVFQDPYSSLDPRWRVGRSIAEPLQRLPMTAAEREQRLAEVLDAVQLDPDAARRFPHQFSGGQRQRLAIARALATRPSLIVADEPLSALDVSVQAQILALLRDLQRREAISLVLISHDLPAVEVLCDHALVLRHGQVVEHGATADVLGEPRHPYTRSLLSALA